MYGWRRREDGVILVWDLPSGPELAPMLAVDQRQGFDLGEAKYHELNAAAEWKHGLPPGWLAAMEWRESGFNPRAFRLERRKDGTPIADPSGRPLTGVGLLQITNSGLKGLHTDEELYDPALNIEIAARYLSFLRSKYGDDFPKVAAAYNAGSVVQDGSEPWNMRQTAGHVSSEVSALNYFLARQQAQHEHELTYLEGVAVAQQFDLQGLVDWEGRASRDTVPAPPPPSERQTMPEIAVEPAVKPEGES